MKIKLVNLYRSKPSSISSSISLRSKFQIRKKFWLLSKFRESTHFWKMSVKISHLANRKFGKTDNIPGFRKNHWTGFYFADSTMVLTRFLLISPLITLIVLMSKNHIFNRIGCNLRFFKNFNISPHFGSFGNSKLILVGQLTLLEWPLWSAHHGILTAAATATDTNAVNYHYYNHVELYF